VNILAKFHELFYSTSAHRKLEVAERLLSLYGEELVKDPHIAQLLGVLSAREENVRQQMGLMEMDRTCSRCAREGGGGCCSAAFAEETDAVQLLMNMLAGVVVVNQYSLGGTECRYLGEKGCIFRYKPMFCLNYICPSITRNEPKDALGRLEKHTGILLQTQLDVERLLIDFFIRISRDHFVDFQN